jgi:hypothetical protein
MNAAALRISRKPGSHDEGSSSGLTGLVVQWLCVVSNYGVAVALCVRPRHI